MTGIITVTNLGIDTGPFNIYSDVDGYVSAFATNISGQDLLTGISLTMPNDTAEIKIKSNGVCTNSLNVLLSVAP